MQWTRIFATYNDRGDIVQVGVTTLINGEARAEVWRDVGPFCEPDLILYDAWLAARNHTARQLPGQLSLVPEPPPPPLPSLPGTPTVA